MYLYNANESQLHSWSLMERDYSTEENPVRVKLLGKDIIYWTRQMDKPHEQYTTR